MADERSSAQRVAIIGGGCASLTAALELTEPQLNGRFAVTIYQLGWRLGGKGASGRSTNARIEEHGLHIWMGFYENAFRLMRRVFSEAEPLRAHCPIRTWREAFFPIAHVGLTHWNELNGWDLWSTCFPELPGLPGEMHTQEADGDPPLSLQDYFIRSLHVLAALVESGYASRGRATPEERPAAHWTDPWARARHVLTVGLESLARPVNIVETLRLLTVICSAVTTRKNPDELGVFHQLGDLCLNAIERLPAVNLREPVDEDIARIREIIDLMAASVRGSLACGLIFAPEGFDKVDHWDFRDWLFAHGARESSVNSAFLRGIYSLMFAYQHGDFRRPRMSAAVGLRVCARMFLSYRGAFFWKMRSGMGDIVFSPMYQVLRARGVEFKFFHRFDRLELAGSGSARHVSSLHFCQQTQLKTREYEPLFDVKGVPCWPAEPLWDQLLDGERAKQEGINFEAVTAENAAANAANIELQVGRDFDFVVLGTSIGDLPRTCAAILAEQPSWRTMVEYVGTVATQALQLWMTPTLPQLGWSRGPVVATAFHNPFDTWADMTHLLDQEDWPSDAHPGSLAYFCNVLPDHCIPANDSDAADQAVTAVRGHAIEFVEQSLGKLWTNLVDDSGHVDWKQMYSVEGDRNVHAIDTQYYRANTQPSDRYVLALPGSSKYRISPLTQQYDNLTIAGDWTDCGLNVGCIEATVMSGMLAAHALCQSPALEDIIGFDHP